MITSPHQSYNVFARATEGTEAGKGGGVNVSHSLSPPPPVILYLLRACTSFEHSFYYDLLHGHVFKATINHLYCKYNTSLRQT